jgi:predicted MFS family arabinose efflux permease
LWTWSSLAAVPVLAGGFVAHQHRRTGRGLIPLMSLDLFRSRTFAFGTVTAMCFSLVPPSFFFVLALYLQQGRGYSALFSGVVFVAVGVGYFLALFLASPLAARLGHRVLTVGALVVAAGAALLAEEAHTGSAWELTPGLALVGFGIGAVLVPLSATVLAGVDPAQAGSAAGVLTTAQQVGGAVGVALTGVVFFAAGEVEHAYAVCLVLLAVCAVGAGLLARWVRPAAPDKSGRNLAE